MSDTFRIMYKPLKQENSEKIVKVKIACEEVEKFMLTVKSREMSLALTNLEQACMWCIKAIALDDEKEQQSETVQN